ncbi:MAG TPA: methyl-accepting chemotaxis protein [Atribacteraceae bacterium]|nr:methyl-accepting chemotaxis protein [Atribacteraceae bacterium]
MRISAKISLGFMLLAILAAGIGSVAIFAFFQVRGSLEEVRKQTPMFFTTSRMKDVLFDLNALMNAFLWEENDAALDRMSGEFDRLEQRFMAYMEALRLGSESVEFQESPYAQAWDEEAFPFPLEAIPQESPLQANLQALRMLDIRHRSNTRVIQDLWRERLQIRRTISETSLAMDEPSRIVESFISLVGDTVVRLTNPIDEVFFLLFRYTAGGARDQRLAAGIDAYFASFEQDVERSTLISQASKDDILAKTDIFQEAWSRTVAIIRAGEDPGETFMEFNRSYRALKGSLNRLRLDPWLKEINTINQGRMNYLVAADPEKKAQIRKQIDAAFTALGGFLEEEFLVAYDATMAQSVIEDRWLPFRDMWRDIIRHEGLLAPLDSQTQRAIHETREIGQRLSDSMEEMNRVVFVNFEETVADLAMLESRLSRILYLVTAVVLLLAVTLGVILSRSIVRPIRQSVAFAQVLEHGDLSQEIEEKRSDEMGTLFTSLNRASRTLREFLREVADSSERIINSMHNLHRTSQEIAQSQDQIAQTVSQVAQGSDEQSKSLTEISRNMESLLNGIREMAHRLMDQSEKASRSLEEVKEVRENIGLTGENMASVKEAASSAFRATTLGQETLKDVVVAMGDIRESVLSVGEVVEKLGKSSREIGNITDLITGIADETNLLALNAAIEAARAGEAGRGFAVVAQEVRKLAEESAQAAQRISGLIGEIQSEAGKTVKSMGKSREKVETGAGAVEKAREAFGDVFQANRVVADEAEKITISFSRVEASSQRIAELVGEVTEISRQAYAQTRSVVESTESVFGSLNTVASISEENASGAEEVAAASQEQHAAFQETEKSVADTVKQAEALKGDLEKFTI